MCSERRSMARHNKVSKDFTYYSIIKEAIKNYPYERATSQQIFNYITTKHPELFKSSNSMTWKGNIRQLLSKSPEFVKLKKDDDSKLHYWTHKPLDQIRAEENELNNCLGSPFKFNSACEFDSYGNPIPPNYYYDYYQDGQDAMEDPYGNVYYDDDFYSDRRYRNYYRRYKK
jgi:Forkhead domain